MAASSPQACTADFTAALIGRDMPTALALLSDDVVCFYSNGSAIVGKEAFSSLMTTSWKMVEDYAYSTANVAWIAQSDTAASVIYSSHGRGMFRTRRSAAQAGRPASS